MQLQCDNNHVDTDLQSWAEVILEFGCGPKFEVV